MSMKHCGKLVVIVMCLLALVACNSTKKNKGANGMAGEGSAYSMGMGSQNGIQGNELAASYSTKAPTNQIYYFEFDASNLHEEYLPSIDAQAHYLAEHPNARVLLTGNTDARGSREYNIALGERRAESVYQRMMSAGVKKSQLRLVSYGSERPVALGSTDEDHAKNRRVELVYETIN